MALNLALEDHRSSVRGEGNHQRKIVGRDKSIHRNIAFHHILSFIKLLEQDYSWGLVRQFILLEYLFTSSDAILHILVQVSCSVESFGFSRFQVCEEPNNDDLVRFNKGGSCLLSSKIFSSRSRLLLNPLKNSISSPSSGILLRNTLLEELQSW